jgi:hypothetical protein
METVRYSTQNQWVGSMKCPSCSLVTPAWRSSGMSDCAPHFYCNRCSNVIHRKADKMASWERQDEEVLNHIAATLPECPCGGRFEPGADPKCPHCGTEFKNPTSAVERLKDLFMIVLHGACCFGDRGPYKVEIYGSQ